MVLKGRNNQINCDEYIINWNLLTESNLLKETTGDPTESIHNVMQGRLIEIGNIRGYLTFCPDKMKSFNKKPLKKITQIDICPLLQYNEHTSLKNIDVLWFRKTNNDFYPEYAFEIELTTGIWPGFVRLATLREYNTKLYIISQNERKFNQVKSSFPEIESRNIHLFPEKISLLYSAEKNLINMRKEFNL